MPLTRATTTPLPDEIYDVWAPRLGAAELKVLLYIVRRTLGFRKRADAISLTQFVRGVTTRDGRVLDHGCGVRNRSNLVRALRNLEAIGLITASRSDTAAGDSDVTTYALRWEGDVADCTATPGDPRPARGGAGTAPGWSRPDAEVVPIRHHRGLLEAPTTNSIPTNMQQHRVPTRPTDAHKDMDSLEARGLECGDDRDRGREVWRAVLGEVREELTPRNFETWFAPTTGVSFDGQALIVAVPTEGHRHWLSVRLRRRIVDALGRLGHGQAALDFVIRDAER